MSLDFSSNFLQFRIAMESGDRSSNFAFDGFRIDTQKLMLYQGEEEISISPKAVKILAILVEKSGAILSKEELIEQVWPDAVVEESNLSQHLYVLRKILGRRADGGPYIETLRRRGYRLRADVEQIDPRLQIRTHTGAEERHTASAAVRRSGNILRLADWTSPRTTSPAKHADIDRESGFGPRLLTVKVFAALGFTLFSAALIAGAYQWYRTAPRASATTEVSVTRLTNGAKPVGVTISPSGEYFVYHEVAEDREHLWLQQVGQSSRLEIDPQAGRSYGGKTFTPNGQYVYFSAQEQTDEEASLYRVAAIGGPVQKILTGIYGPVSFSPDGREIVFLRKEPSFDGLTLAIADQNGTNQRSLLRSDERYRIVGLPAWSPNGEHIAFARMDVKNEPGVTSLCSISVTDSSIKPLSEEKWENIYRIEWLRDGRGLVMIATRLNEAYTTRRNQVYFISFPGGESRRLTTDGSWHDEWSLGVTNDGAVIAAPFNLSSQLWVMDPSGLETTAIQISNGLRDGRAGLAPLLDGRIGFIARLGDEINIWLVNPDGTQLRQLTYGIQAAEELRSDPQGRYFVFSVWQERRNHLYRIDTDGQNMRQLTFGDGWEVDSTISPDGEWVVYGSERLNEKPALYQISINGGEPHRFGNSTDCTTPNYSPGGETISCIRNGGREVLLLSAVNGAEIRTIKLPTNSIVNFGARWIPDGTGLVFRRVDKGQFNLWVQPLDGTPARQLSNFTKGEIYNFAYSADGRHLFLARGQQVADAILLKDFLAH